MAKDIVNAWEDGRKLFARAAGLNPDRDRKREALVCLGEAVAEKRLRYTPPFTEFLRIQLQYIPLFFWAAQGFLVLGVFLFFWRFSGRGADFWAYLRCGSVAATWLGVLCHGMLGRHFFSGMSELEQSCYINLSQMWIIRMLLCNGMDILFLTVIGGWIAADTETPAGCVMTYLLVPFVLSDVCCLLAVNMSRSGKNRFALAALAVAMALIALCFSAVPELYDAACLWVWIAVLVTAALVFAWQIRSCYYKMIRGDIICLN